MSRKEAHKGVAVFRRVYREIPETWYALEDAVMRVIRRKTDKLVIVNEIVSFHYEAPYLVCTLPSGRRIYYLEPEIKRVPFEYVDRKTGEKVPPRQHDANLSARRENSNGYWIGMSSYAV